MHVLFIPSWYPETRFDPFGSFFREQALAMLNSGCTVGVIAPRLVSLKNPINSIKVAGRLKFELDEKMPTYRRAVLNVTPGFWRLNAQRIASAGWELYRIYLKKHGRPDIIHVHSTVMGGAAAKLIFERDGIPFVISEHSSAYARGKIPEVGKEIIREVAKQASGTFAVSTPFCRVLEKVLELPVGSYNCVPNMVDHAFLTEPLPAKKGFRKRLLHVSMLDQNKEVQLMLRAFRDAFDGDKEIHLTIGGDGPELSNLKRLANDLDIVSQVNFVGRLTREQVRSAMAHADAFLLSSRYETFGVVLIEALAMGIPVVATSCGGPEEIVTAQRGILVPKGDVQAYAEALRTMIGALDSYNPHDLRKSCEADYGPEAISTIWLNIYKQAIGQARNEP